MCLAYLVTLQSMETWLEFKINSSEVEQSVGTARKEKETVMTF